MDAVSLIDRLDIRLRDGEYRVSARESSDLEFKRDLSLQAFRKSLKTISAFSNQAGGSIVFGVQDRPRVLVGIDGANLDEGLQSEQLLRSISPCPETEFFEFECFGFELAALYVHPVPKPPSIAIRDLVGDGGQERILQQGMIYKRRRGQTAAISGEEFAQILAARDESTRQEIFNFLKRGQSVGFDQAIIADARGVDNDGEGVTFFLPAEAASDLNVIERARLVEQNGAPAYEITGNVQLTVPAQHDPRVPMRAGDSANEMREEILEVFGQGFPWNFGHLKKAAEHLGFWPDANGNDTNTGREQITGTPIYFRNGRNAILNWARQNPNDFVEVVASQATRAAWQAHEG
ncbi:ATP-binding protein [uncultured Tateyamaria sp.]|uniref:ATP-binding protein n=1 Tax=uncultured Tateyamaria sp. TaxID=455651 RepID=UPI00260E89D2|nr:ATP-binding protein [uncultured Tateyamaria sp.]